MNASLKGTRLINDFVRRPPFLYRRLRRVLERVYSAPLPERRAFAEERLVRVIEAASRTDHYRRIGRPRSFHEFPHISNEDVRDSARATFASSPTLRTRAATSGTSGVPLQLRRSLAAVAAEQAVLDLVVARAGVDLAGARVAVIRGDFVKDLNDFSPPFWRYGSGGNTLVFSSNHLTRDTIEACWEELDRFRPAVVWVYPSSLEAFCGLAGETRPPIPGVELVLSSSEVLREETRVTASRHFNAPVYDYYGQAERVNFASSERAGEFAFSPGYGRTELLFSRSDGEEDFYEIVGTSFWNLAQPLIRYRTGDLAILPRGLSEEAVDEVCYGVRPFLGIAGREQEYIETPHGGRLVGLNMIPRNVKHVVQMQLIQTAPDAVDIHVVPKTGYSDTAARQIMKNARVKIPQSMKVQIRVVEQIERTARGKTPLVVRRIGRESMQDVAATTPMARPKRVFILVPGQQGGIDRLFAGLDLSEIRARGTLSVRRFTTHGTLLKGILLFPVRISHFVGLLASGKIDLCHINIASKGSTLRKMIFAHACRAFGVPYVLHLHGSEYREFFARLSDARAERVRQLYQGAEAVLVLGEVWKEFVTSQLGVKDQKALILPNAVSGPSSLSEAPPEEPPRILFLGRLGVRKGVPELIEAFADPRMTQLDWTATVAGDGDIDPYQKSVEDKGLAARVTLPGWVGPAEVSALLERSSILVLPSRAENLPLSMLEGMAYGMATVVTPVGAVTDVIEDGVNGVLVPVNAPAELAGAIVDLLEDPERRATLGRAARDDFESHYDARDYPGKLAELYADALLRAGDLGRAAKKK